MFIRLLFLTLLAGVTAFAAAPDEPTFEILTVGAQVYSNVTVTTRTRTDVFITHAHGIASIKVIDLDHEAQVKLGYELPKPVEPPRKKFSLPTPSLNLDPKFREMEEKLAADATEKLRTVAPLALAAGFGLFLVFYFLFCYLCKLICLKAGHKPGFLIWLPIVKQIPLLRAANMSAVWFVALFVPLLNIIAYITWALNISKARGKGFWTMLGLCLPIFNLIAFLYLALADSVPEDEASQKVVRFHTTDQRKAV